MRKSKPGISRISSESIWRRRVLGACRHSRINSLSGWLAMWPLQAPRRTRAIHIAPTLNHWHAVDGLAIYRIEALNLYMWQLSPSEMHGKYNLMSAIKERGDYKIISVEGAEPHGV